MILSVSKKFEQSAGDSPVEVFGCNMYFYEIEM